MVKKKKRKEKEKKKKKKKKKEKKEKRKEKKEKRREEKRRGREKKEERKPRHCASCHVTTLFSRLLKVIKLPTHFSTFACGRGLRTPVLLRLLDDFL